MLKEIKNSLALFLLMVVITGIIYPMFITGVAKVLFSNKAEGSLIENNGKVSGSELIGQQFTRPEYFHPRPSSAGTGYDAMNSGGSNLSPTNLKLESDISERLETLQKENPDKAVPVDLITASASGLDPHISPEAALFQVTRVAKARNMDEADVTRLVTAHTEERTLGIFGEPRVNVLLLNIDLDKQASAK